MTLDLDDRVAIRHVEEAEKVPESELLIHRLGILMELTVQISLAEPVHQALQIGPQWYVAYMQAIIEQTHI